jgi:putative alpha-1,2-mannosidase
LRVGAGSALGGVATLANAGDGRPEGYVVGTPRVRKAVECLSNGKTFTVTVAGVSQQKVYVKPARERAIGSARADYLD